jgi:hypothetical protein
MCPTREPLDYSCRVSSAEMGWPPELCPLLFAAQYKANDHARAKRILASAFHPMMILLILYYLDTRNSVEDPLPSWMVLFGVVYDERGISIHAHHPEIVDRPHYQSGSTERVWGARSRQLGKPYEEFWEWSLGRRPKMLATLCRIQGHCRYVLDRLKSWQGYRQACSQFLA